eukprot:814988-Alexandrium_andersonii.AAC.1
MKHENRHGIPEDSSSGHQATNNRGPQGRMTAQPVLLASWWERGVQTLTYAGEPLGSSEPNSALG